MYKDLQENKYGFYKVRGVDLGRALVLENLQTGQIYEIKEYSATFWAEEDMVFPARVSRVGDHYELVNAPVQIMPVKLTPALENEFRRTKINWNPQTIWHHFLKPRETPPRSAVSLAEAEANFRNALKRCQLNRFVSTETVKEWIYEYGDFELTVNLLLGLLFPEVTDFDTFNELILSLVDFYNYCPQKGLGGQSPQERRRADEEKVYYRT